MSDFGRAGVLHVTLELNLDERVQMSVIDFLYLINTRYFIFKKKTTTYPPLQPRSSLTVVVFFFNSLLLKLGILSVISSVVLIHPVPLDHPAYKAGRGVTLRALA